MSKKEVFMSTTTLTIIWDVSLLVIACLFVIIFNPRRIKDYNRRDRRHAWIRIGILLLVITIVAIMPWAI